MKIVHRYNNPNEIMNKEEISKSTLYSWLNKLQKEKMITKSFQGHYVLTDKGTDYVDTYEKEDSKNQVRLENMRYVYPIIQGIHSLIKNRTWDKEQPMNNDVVIYHTKEDGLHVRAIVGKNNPCLEITCKQILGDDIYEIMYDARQWTEFVAEKFQKDYSVILGLGKPAMKPEWAIPSEFAKVLLEKMNSSQISTTHGVINKSKGRGYDIETRDIRLANKLFNLPYVVDEIALQLKSLRVASNTGLFSL
jgi:DNA-binding PadR family transcriptional regulator